MKLLRVDVYALILEMPTNALRQMRAHNARRSEKSVKQKRRKSKFIYNHILL